MVLVADAFYGLQSIWEEVTFAMANAWTVFTEAIQFGWRSVQHDLEKGLYDVIGLYKEHTKLFTALAPGLAAALELSGFAEIDTEQAKKSADQEFSKDANRLSEERSNTLIGRKTRPRTRSAWRTRWMMQMDWCLSRWLTLQVPFPTIGA